MTKNEIATLLAENEYSVQIGMQTLKYWVNDYMGRYNLAGLTLLLEAATESDPKVATELRTQANGSPFRRF
jgi:hypothetical protein